MRGIRSSIRTAAVAAAALLAGALLAAPAGQGAPPHPAAAPASPRPPAGRRRGLRRPVRCTIGFNVRDSSGAYYFLPPGTAARRRHGLVRRPAHTKVLGTTVAVSASRATTTAIVKYAAGIVPPGTVRPVHRPARTSSRRPMPSSARRSSAAVATTGVRSGTVTAINATVNYAEGTVTGLIKTNVCAEGGDSGRPALRRHQGARPGLRQQRQLQFSGGTTYFQPVTETAGGVRPDASTDSPPGTGSHLPPAFARRFPRCSRASETVEHSRF